MAAPPSRLQKWQRQAVGSFADLSFGKVHYRLWGVPREGDRLIVCVHGFSTDASIWENNIALLAKAGTGEAAGTPVLAVDVYGRGHSAGLPEDMNYSEGAMVSCLAELLLHLAERTFLASVQRVILVGYSMGGAIATSFAARHPHIVQQLVLIAPAGLPQDLPMSARLVAMPVLGDMLFMMAARSSMMKHVQNGYYNTESEEVKEHMARAKERLKLLFELHPGFPRALVSTLQSFPLHELQHTYEESGRLGVRTLVIWGDRDTTVPYTPLCALMRSLLPHAAFCVLEDAGHADMFACARHRDAMVKAVAALLEDDKEESKEDKEAA